MGELKPQGLANTAWAFATADHHDASLFSTLGAAAEQRICDFNPQSLGNTAWAFAKARQNDASLFAALAAAAKQFIGSFTPADLLKFVRSHEWTNGKDQSWARTVTPQHVHKYTL